METPLKPFMKLLVCTFEKQHEIPGVVEYCIGRQYVFIRKSNGRSFSFRRSTLDRIDKETSEGVKTVYRNSSIPTVDTDHADPNHG